MPATPSAPSRASAPSPSTASARPAVRTPPSPSPVPARPAAPATPSTPAAPAQSHDPRRETSRISPVTVPPQDPRMEEILNLIRWEIVTYEQSHMLAHLLLEALLYSESRWEVPAGTTWTAARDFVARFDPPAPNAKFAVTQRRIAELKTLR